MKTTMLGAFNKSTGECIVLFNYARPIGEWIRKEYGDTAYLKTVQVEFLSPRKYQLPASTEEREDDTENPETD